MPNQHTRFPVPVDTRFWAKVHKSGPTIYPDLGPCWIWTAGTGRRGYGSFSVSHRLTIQSHRYAWELHYGPIPKGLCVCHTCDTPSCVRNDDEGFYEVNGLLHPRRGHLWLGTLADNVTDRVRKGRSRYIGPKNPAYGDRNASRLYPEKRPRGEQHYSAKLIPSTVLEIRTRYASGNETMDQLAREYGVKQRAVAKIIHRISWRHVL